MSDVLERIEMKIAFLEQGYQELSDVVYRQQCEIDRLRQLLASAQGQIEALRSPAPVPPAEDERPPHY